MEFTKSQLESLKSMGKDICFNVNDSRFDEIRHTLKPKDFEKISSRSVYYWRRKQRPIPLRHLSEICKAHRIGKLNIESVSSNSGKHVKLPDIDDLKLCYLLGIILGDGCMNFNKKHENGGSYTLQITSRYKKDAVKIKELIKKTFNIDSSIYRIEGCYNTCTFSKPLVIVLNRIFSVPVGKKYKKLKVPRNLINSQIRSRYFLKGMFDSDGNIYEYRNKKAVQLRQKSKRFTTEILHLMRSMGIDIGGLYYDKANDSWLLWTSKKETVYKFMNKINLIKLGP